MTFCAAKSCEKHWQVSKQNTKKSVTHEVEPWTRLDICGKLSLLFFIFFLKFTQYVVSVRFRAKSKPPSFTFLLKGLSARVRWKSVEKTHEQVFEPAFFRRRAYFCLLLYFLPLRCLPNDLYPKNKIIENWFFLSIFLKYYLYFLSLYTSKITAVRLVKKENYWSMKLIVLKIGLVPCYSELILSGRTTLLGMHSV